MVVLFPVIHEAHIVKQSHLDTGSNVAVVAFRKPAHEERDVHTVLQRIGVKMARDLFQREVLRILQDLFCLRTALYQIIVIFLFHRPPFLR